MHFPRSYSTHKHRRRRLLASPTQPGYRCCFVWGGEACRPGFEMYRLLEMNHYLLLLMNALGWSLTLAVHWAVRSMRL